MTSCVRIICAKNYLNLTIGVQLTVGNVGDVFWDTVYIKTKSPLEKRKPQPMLCQFSSCVRQCQLYIWFGECLLYLAIVKNSSDLDADPDQD